MTNVAPRDPKGRFLPVFCNDPNCDGSLIFDDEFGSSNWICDGLTHDRPNGPLRACGRNYPALTVKDETGGAA